MERYPIMSVLGRRLRLAVMGGGIGVSMVTPNDSHMDKILASSRYTR